MPTLNSFAKRPFSVPECLHCDENIIILDDLRTKGYDVIDKVQGFSTEQLENVVKVKFVQFFVFFSKNCTL